MLRIGIMLDSYVSSAWVAKIIEDIQASSFARIELVVLNTPPPAVRPPLGNASQSLEADPVSSL